MYSLFVSTPCLCPLPCSQAELINKHCLTWSTHLSPDVSWQGGYCLGQPTFHWPKTAFSFPSKRMWHQSMEEEGFVVGWRMEERVRCSGVEMVCACVIQLSVATPAPPSMPHRKEHYWDRNSSSNFKVKSQKSKSKFKVSLLWTHNNTHVYFWGIFCLIPVF